MQAVKKVEFSVTKVKFYHFYIHQLKLGGIMRIVELYIWNIPRNKSTMKCFHSFKGCQEVLKLP